MRLRIGGNTVLRTGEDHTHNNWQSRSYDISSYDGYTDLTLGHDASTTGFSDRRASMSYIRLDA